MAVSAQICECDSALCVDSEGGNQQNLSNVSLCVLGLPGDIFWCFTAWQLGQAHAVLDRNHARGEDCGAPSPGDARLPTQSPVAQPNHPALLCLELT